MTSSSFPSDHNFESLCETIRAHWLGLATGEAAAACSPAAPPLRVSERLVQAIWYEKLLQPEGLKTVSGKPLRILNAGRWNQSAGPDFLAAEIELNGQRMAGDIEVHVESSQWVRHGHVRDFAYNNVILHVVLKCDDSRQTDELHNGERIERLALEPFLFPDLETIRQTLSPEDYPYNTDAGLGRCQEYFAAEDEGLIRRFLESGGRERMESKIRRIERQGGGESLGQLFYQALMTSMGFKGNKTLFFLLAKRTPVEELLSYSRTLQGMEKVERIEAMLLHVAGLTPRSDEDKAQLPPETLEYLNHLNAHWAEVCGYFSDRLIPPTRRWHSGARPVNFPERRLAGIAHFILRFAEGTDIFSRFQRLVHSLAPSKPSARDLRQFLKAVEELFAVDAAPDFWSRHYSFAANPAPTPMSLIGDSRARSLAFNVAIPLLLFHARQQRDETFERFLWQWFARFPALESNNVERFMRYRLFGASPRASSMIDSELMQQGLFQVFYTCCNNNERDCSQCLFLKERERGLQT